MKSEAYEEVKSEEEDVKRNTKNEERRTIMYQSNITKDEISQLPLKAFEGRIILIDKMRDFDRYIEVIENEPVWGFDTETRPAFRKGVIHKPALLQLANSAYAFLFRLNHTGIPQRMVRVINNPDILKIGVALHDDLKDMKLYKQLKPDGFIDLQKMVGDFGIESKGLTKLTAIILNFRISKSQRVTNWENKNLTNAQLKYAATDAWVCYEIYQELKKQNRSK